MSEQTLAEQTQMALEKFLSGLAEQDQAIIGSAFQRLMKSDVAAKAIGVGDPMPDFILPNAQGNDVQLSSLLMKGPVVINFYRGGWCPFCNMEFKALHNYMPQMQEYNATLIGIAPETPEATSQTIEKHELKFEVLCDQGNQLADKLGLVMTVDEAIRPLYEKWGIDIPAANGDDTFELPVPATYVIDTQSEIRAAYIDKNYTQRMEPADIIKKLASL